MDSLRDQAIEAAIKSIESTHSHTHTHRQIATLAADAILKLTLPRGESELREALTATAAHLAAAVSLLEGGGKKAAWSDKVFHTMIADYKSAIDRARQALATPSAPVSGLVAEIDALKCGAQTLLDNVLDRDAWQKFRDETGTPGNVLALISEVERLREANELKSALASRDAWRPIETAPKDGTSILGYRPFDGNWKENQDYFVEVRWRTDSFGWTGFMGIRGQRWGVTHWMPLPTPPTSQERKS